MGVSYGHIVPFPWMLEEVWGWEDVDDGVYQQGVRHLLSSCRLSR